MCPRGCDVVPGLGTSHRAPSPPGEREMEKVSLSGLPRPTQDDTHQELSGKGVWLPGVSRGTL